MRPKREPIRQIRLGPPSIDVSIARAPKRDYDASVYQTPRWRSLVGRLKGERGRACQRCGAPGRVIGDHIVELRDGGEPFDPSNVMLMCDACHKAKTARARAARFW